MQHIYYLNLSDVSDVTSFITLVMVGNTLRDLINEDLK